MREEVVDIVTADGAMETFVCRPERGGPYPPVLLLMDAPGIRDELHDMARRLATVGYFVMLPNLYYRAGRDTKYGPDVLDPASRRPREDAGGPHEDDHPSGHGGRGRAARSCGEPRRDDGRPRRCARLLHERPVRAGRGRALSAAHRGCRVPFTGRGS